MSDECYLVRCTHITGYRSSHLTCMLFPTQTHVRLQPLMLTVHRNTFLQVQHMLAVDYDRQVLQWKHELESSLENAWIQVTSGAPCIVLHEL